MSCQRFDDKVEAVKREREAQLAQAKENLARLTDEVELAIHTAYNKRERTEQMLKVSEEVVARRTESNRVLQIRVFPEPVGPKNSKFPIGREGDCNPAQNIWYRSTSACTACSCPTTFSRRARSNWQAVELRFSVSKTPLSP
jgi:hypothetical protein